ncbi:MAG TPA: hypothetical protein VFG52_05510 [Xanthomonadales bacterium]|nr:hypothetical protein [Xanthomonadales bacterium]
MFKFKRLLALALLLCTAGFAFKATASGLGGDSTREYWVDGPADVQPGTNRGAPDVAMNGQGQSIHVWEAFSSMTLRNDIFLRRIDRNGSPLADPVQVNSLATDDQFNARIAVSPDGTFLVIWQSDEFDAVAGAIRIWIRAQAFAANGSPMGGERLISAQSTGFGSNIRADVAALTGGGYVVVWEQNGAGGSDTNSHIRARLVAADGATSAASFVANSSISSVEADPAVSELDSGGFLVIWRQGDIWGRIFDSTGNAVGSDQQLDSNAPTAKFNPDVARGADGRLLVVWEDEDAAGDGFEIRGRMFSPTLTAQGSDFRINTLLSGVQEAPRVGAYGSLGFLVVWASDVSAGNDAEPRSIEVRRVTGNNEFGGAQLQLNRWTTGNQHQPAIGGMEESIAVAWRSAAGNDEEVDDVITGQTWSVCGIFCDGFE